MAMGAWMTTITGTGTVWLSAGLRRLGWQKRQLRERQRQSQCVCKQQYRNTNLSRHQQSQYHAYRGGSPGTQYGH
jgi:hypothetical protein